MCLCIFAYVYVGVRIREIKQNGECQQSPDRKQESSLPFIHISRLNIKLKFGEMVDIDVHKT
jgi:hypothetical protein